MLQFRKATEAKHASAMPCIMQGQPRPVCYGCATTCSATACRKIKAAKHGPHFGKLGMRPSAGKGLVHARVLKRSSMACLSICCFWGLRHIIDNGSQAIR